MKILFMVFSPPASSFGSLTRIMALAKAFLTYKNTISFCAAGPVAQIIEKKGFITYHMPESTMFGLPLFLSNIIKKRSQNLQIPVKEGKAIGSIWFVYALSGMLSKSYLETLVDAQLAVITKYKPDLIVTEMDPGAYLAARIANIPLITTFAKVMLAGYGTFFWKKARKVINAVLTAFSIEHSIEPEEMLIHEKVLRIIPSIPELDGYDPNETNVLYTGNLLEPIRDTQEAFVINPKTRYIFVYLGTGSLSLDLVKSILPEAFQIYPDVECFVAAQSLTSPYTVGNVTFTPYVPAEKILPYCDLVICHGGLNTITQSLEYGVPLLLFPGPIFERRRNAEMVLKNQAGAMGEHSQFTVSWIRGQYEQRAQFDKGVALLQQRFKTYNGAGDAVIKIMDWVEQGCCVH